MKKFIVFCIVAVIALVSFNSIAKPSKYVYFKGKVGNYDITLKIREDGGHRFNGGDQWITDYVGSYTYTKAGNTLNLEGTTDPTGGGNICLVETTPKGNTSAYWYLDGDPYYANTLTGTMTVIKSDKTFRVILHKVKNK